MGKINRQGEVMYQVIQYVPDAAGNISKDSYVVCFKTDDEEKAKAKLKRNLEAGFRSQIKVVR